ncbi:MAG TPA: hypothetical protein DEP45_07500 [Armatimonadetes bacterium]|nr:hypothetical protein [Armatimonadota bacterium]
MRLSGTWKLLVGIAVTILLAWLVAWLSVEQNGAASKIAELAGAVLRSADAEPEEADGPWPPVIAFVGDVLPLADRDYWGRMGSLLTSADLTICNLECPISSRGSRTELKLDPNDRALPNEYFFRAPPHQAAKLAEGGFDAVTLANNHIMDYGNHALEDTLRPLDEAGILHTGAGMDRDAAREPLVTTLKGERIAIVAYVDAATLPDTTHFAAKHDTPGTVFVHGDGSGQPTAQTVKLLREDIGAASRQADFVIASFHWGTEGKDDPAPLQRNLAHLAIDSGAKMVIGHHPHVLQGLEIYKGCPIAYSLGNFAFPTPWVNNQFTAVLNVQIEDGRWKRLAWHPVRMEHITGVPAPAQGGDRRRMISRLSALSGSLGTTYQTGGEGAPLWLQRSTAAAEDAFATRPHPEVEGMAVVSFRAWELEESRKVARERRVVVAQELADEVRAIFREIYEREEQFPIAEVIGYDYRTLAGSEDRLSFHAAGRAVDLNRRQNPMIEGGRKIVHPDEPPYEPGEWRPGEDPYSITPDGSVVHAFTSRGWRWGGNWTSMKDYQHFDKPR